MNDDLLRDYVFARNSRRSAEKAAEGFVTGQRIFALKEALQREQIALTSLADWVEDRARAELAMPSRPS